MDKYEKNVQEFKAALKDTLSRLKAAYVKIQLEQSIPRAWTDFVNNTFKKYIKKIEKIISDDFPLSQTEKIEQIYFDLMYKINKTYERYYQTYNEAEKIKNIVYVKIFDSIKYAFDKRVR